MKLPPMLLEPLTEKEEDMLARARPALVAHLAVDPRDIDLIQVLMLRDWLIKNRRANHESRHPDSHRDQIPDRT
jgi:hypothetical protein